MGSLGLRVLALAYGVLPLEQADTVAADPMAAVDDLVFVGLVGIIDPLRPEAIEAVRTAREAGIDVRMITGDHLVTAQAIGSELGLERGGMTGQEFAATDDATLLDQLPNLHVFGRVSPQDKLRLVQLLQEQGNVVAMTGDAVNDAAALKQADIGVAMGSGSEVSKQAAKMILTDDNFATLVHAVELGRAIYVRITAYIGYQRSQLFGLVSMFLLATALNVKLRCGAAAAAGPVPQLHPRGHPGHHHHPRRGRPGPHAGATARPPRHHLQPHHRGALGLARGAPRSALAAPRRGGAGRARH